MQCPVRRAKQSDPAEQVLVVRILTRGIKEDDDMKKLPYCNSGSDSARGTCYRSNNHDCTYSTNLG